jgi:hypothetical protein
MNPKIIKHNFKILDILTKEDKEIYKLNKELKKSIKGKNTDKLFETLKKLSSKIDKTELPNKDLVFSYYQILNLNLNDKLKEVCGIEDSKITIRNQTGRTVTISNIINISTPIYVNQTLQINNQQSLQISYFAPFCYTKVTFTVSAPGFTTTTHTTYSDNVQISPNSNFNQFIFY